MSQVRPLGLFYLMTVSDGVHVDLLGKNMSTYVNLLVRIRILLSFSLSLCVSDGTHSQ